jgi:hypothetical protein
MTRVARTLISLTLAASTAACTAGSPGVGITTSPTTVGATHPTGSSSPSGSPGTTCGQQVQAEEPDSGTTVCVARGGELIVLLHNVAGSSWSEPQVVGSALGAGMGIPTPYGRVGWLFKALAPGTAQISTSRPNCPPASPGAVTCHSLLAFHLEVEVR